MYDRVIRELDVDAVDKNLGHRAIDCDPTIPFLSRNLRRLNP